MDTSREIAVKELLFYAQCELEAMKAANEMREIRGESPAYGETDFLLLAERTREKYHQIMKWLTVSKVKII